MKKIMIIGSGPGLAWGVAQRFGREGWRVVLVARNAERLAEQTSSLRELGADATRHVLDVTDFPALDELVRQEAADGGIDFLNYNAAVIRSGTRLLETSIADIKNDLLVDLGGAIVAARAAIPQMRDRGSGAIVFSGGDLCFNPQAVLMTLGAGKAGMRNVAAALSKDPDCAQVRVAYVNIDAHIVGDVPGEIADLYWEIYHEPTDSRGWDLNYSHPYLGRVP